MTGLPDADVLTRLTELERQVTELQRELQLAKEPHWLDQFMGSMSADPEAFEEMVKLGREFRNADRPTDEELFSP